MYAVQMLSIGILNIYKSLRTVFMITESGHMSFFFFFWSGIIQDKLLLLAVQ